MPQTNPEIGSTGWGTVVNAALDFIFGAADDAQTDIDDHIADATAAHAASAIANTPAGGIAATDVQTALNELDTEKQTAAQVAAAVAPVTATTVQLEDVTHAINTDAAKVAGYEVFNTTTGAPVWAVGNADADAWNDATGTEAHAPV